MTISNQPAAPSRRVLVVDDESSIIELLQNLLEDEGYEVVTASNGREGLAQLARHPVDLVLCDIMMPFVNGLQMCQAMRRGESAFRYIPLVFMSAAGPPAAGHGCDYAAFIYKPFNLDHLFDLIARFAVSAG